MQSISKILIKEVYAASNKALIDCGGEHCIDTAIGKIPVDPTSFTQSFLSLGIGLGGSIALILMLYGFFNLAISAGIPDKVKASQEIITSAVGGLLFIIFSVILMQIIGVNLIGIPGL